MELRIRKANDTESRLLAEIPFRAEVFDGIIPTLTAWGVVDADGNSYDDADIFGQFVDNGEKAYFEVVLSTDD